jgi:hypothetical protein
MTSTTESTRTPTADRHAPVFDLSQALRDGSTPDSPAALTEALMPEIRKSFWMLISSNAVIDGQDTQATRMILERAMPSGVSVAFDVDWQPQRWRLPPQSPPSAEVLRRIRPLARAAQLIRCTREEAEAFFGSTDPVRVHDTLPQRPAVLISDAGGGLHWCIGGRCGRMDPSMLRDHEVFLTQLLDNLSANPQLLGSAGPGIDAVANQEGLTEQLLTAAVASADPDQIQN